MKPGALRTSDLSKVVLPAPLRPISAIFSPRTTLAENRGITFKSSYDFSTLRISSGCFPEFRFMSNLMYGRWMLLLASSVVCSRSTSFFREVACAERVPAENRAINSCNCAIAGVYRAVLRGHAFRAGDFAEEGSRATANDGAGEEQH